MKKSKVLGVCAAIAVAAGVFLILSSIPTETSSTTFTLPAGPYYYRFETATLLNGEVSGDFQVTAGEDVTVMVLDQTEYDSYVESGLMTPLDTASGMTGSFSASLSGVGKLFVVFEHDAFSGGAETDVTIDYKVSGIAVTFLVIGLVLIVAGIVIGVIGARARKKEAAERPPSPAASDVTILSPPPENPKT